MQAIEATGMENYRGDLAYAGYTAALTYAYDAEAKTVTVTDASTVVAGDVYKKAVIHIHDRSGKQVNGSISAAAGNTGAISVATLDLSKPLDITATVTTRKGMEATGKATTIGEAGALGSWDYSLSAVEAIHTGS